MKKEKFLGRGWSFPPTFNLNRGSVDMVEQHEDIRQSLEILLTTSLGERVLRTDFGCGIHTIAFENMTVTLLTKIKRLIEKAVIQYETRISLDNIFFTKSNELEGVLNIELQFTIRTTNTRLNYVYPFYLKEGAINVKG